MKTWDVINLNSRNPPHPVFDHLLLSKEKGFLPHLIPSPYQGDLTFTGVKVKG
jgi:hypothetical protein